MSLSDDSGDEHASPSTPVRAPQHESDRSGFDEEREHFIGEDAEEVSEKRRLIREILEMQATLEALSGRVDSVREENLRLRSENQVLGQYIENLMQASQVFQAIPPSKAAAGTAGRPAITPAQQQNIGRPGNARSVGGVSNIARNAKGAMNGSK